jgi:hypothetical protein
MRSTLSYVAMAGAFVGLATFAVQEVDARGRGGGARAGGATSMSRGGGGSGGSGGGFNRASAGGGSMSRSGSYNRGSVNTGNMNRGNINTGNVNRGNINTGNVNRGNINTGNINTGNINTGNVNINRDVHVDVDNDWHGWGGYYDHPVGAYAAGAMVGAAVTAAAIGSRYYALPTGCAPYPYSGFTYYSCANVWYKPTYQGDTVVYVVVAKPG